MTTTTTETMSAARTTPATVVLPMCGDMLDDAEAAARLARYVTSTSLRAARSGLPPELAGLAARAELRLDY